MRLKPTSLLMLGVVVALAGCSSGSTEPQPDYSKIETFAGTGFPGQGADGQVPTATDLYLPQYITFGPDGNPYVLDWNNHRVRVIENGRFRTLIGTGELGDAKPGNASEIGLNHPTHLSFGPDGMLYLAAWHNSKILRMNLTTEYIEPICGVNGARSYSGDGGPAIDATLDLPVSIIFDSIGNSYVLDQANQRVRRIGVDGMITTVAGTGEVGFAGEGVSALEAKFTFPVGQAAWPAGKLDIDDDDTIYIPDAGNHRIRVMTKEGIISTLAGTGVAGSQGDGGPALLAQLRFPGGVTVGPDGSVYIADTFNHCIRKVSPAHAESESPEGVLSPAHLEDGVITTVCGRCGTRGYGGDGGRPEDALLDRPTSVSFDADGNLYVSDQGNHRIRVIWKLAR